MIGWINSCKINILILISFTLYYVLSLVLVLLY